MHNSDIIKQLEVYKKKLCWHPDITMDAKEQQNLYDILAIAAVALARPSRIHLESPTVTFSPASCRMELAWKALTRDSITIKFASGEANL